MTVRIQRSVERSEKTLTAAPLWDHGMKKGKSNETNPLPLLIAILDHATNRLYTSPYLEGVETPEDLQRATLPHPSDSLKLFHLVAAALERNDGERREETLELTDGTPRFLESTTTAISDGKITRANTVVTIRDVTVQKLKEDADRRFASILEHSSDAILRLSLDGTILSWNPTAERMYGYSANEIVGRPVTDIAPPESGQEMLQLLKRISEGEVVLPFETVRLCRDGTMLNILLTISPIRNDAGHVIGVMSIGRNITELTHMREMLELGDEELDDFLHRSSIGVQWLTPEGTIKKAYQSVFAPLGYSRKEYLNHPFAEFLWDKESDAPLLKALAEGEDIHNREVRLKARDGSRHYVLLNTATDWKGERILHTRCFTRDITEWKRIQELKTTQRAIREHEGEAHSGHTMMPMCAWCKKVRDDQEWTSLEAFVEKRFDADVTHGICPDCIDKYHTKRPTRRHR